MSKSNLQKTIRKERVKNYSILCQKDLGLLRDFYAKCSYPSKTEMENMSKKMGYSIEKIRNWYKHQRKKDKKNSFSKDKIKFLLGEFAKNRNPTSEEYHKLANQLECHIKNVKHWFSHRRKLTYDSQHHNQQSIKDQLNSINNHLTYKKPHFVNTKDEIESTQDQINTTSLNSQTHMIQQHHDEVKLKTEAERKKINAYEEMRTKVMRDLAMSRPLMNFPMGGGLTQPVLPLALAQPCIYLHSDLTSMMFMQNAWNIYQIEQINEYYRRMGCFFSN